MLLRDHDPHPQALSPSFILYIRRDIEVLEMRLTNIIMLFKHVICSQNTTNLCTNYF